MTILELKVENVKRLRAVHLTPNGGNVVLGGDNAQGKSSVLDSILYALGGLGAVCDKPIRDGASKAEVEIDLGEFVVLRRFTQTGGSSLTIKNKAGVAVSSPQGLLDRLVGQLAYDPLAFSRLDAKGQRATLARVAGLDTTALDAEFSQVFDQRAAAKAEVARLQSSLIGKSVVEGLPLETDDSSLLLAKLEAADAVRRQNDVARANAQRIAEKASGAMLATETGRAAVAAAKLALSAAQNELAMRERVFELAREEADAALKRAESLVDPDTGELKTKILNLSERNRQIGENNRIRGLTNELKAGLAKSEALSKRLIGISERKIAAIAAAKMPLPGLTVGEDGVWLNGVPFKQASTSQQIAASAAIGMALNPTLRVMLIRDGSLLDSKTTEALRKIAAAEQTQLWIERVGDGADVSVVIEDGAVKENRLAPAVPASTNDGDY